MQEILGQIYGYLHGMWRYRWSALAIAWLVALGGWFFVYTLPNQYEARAVVHIDTASIMQPLLEGLTIKTDPAEEIEIMTKLLLSRENLLTVIRATDMDLQVNSPQEREKLVKKLARSISVEGSGGDSRRRNSPNDTYEIKYRSTSSQQVYRVVSKLLNTMIEGSLNSSRTDTLMAQKFLDRQIAEYESRLMLAEQQLAKFKKKNVGLMPDERGGYYARLQRAKDDLDATRSQLRLSKQRQSELRRQLSGESPLLDSADFGSEAAAIKMRGYQEQLNDLLTQYTDQHPDVQVLRAKIRDLQTTRTDISQEDYSVGGGASLEYNPVYQDIKTELSKAGVEIGTLTIQLAEKERKVEELKKFIDAIPQVEAELARLNRDYEVTNSRYLNLVGRRESAKLAVEADKSSSEVTFRVIDAPIVPHTPSGPNRMLLLWEVMLAALAAGLGWSVLRYLLCPTFISFKQLRDTFGLPVLGSVSLYLKPEHRRRRRLQITSFILATFMLGGVFGITLWYQNAGSAYVRTVLAGGGNPL